MSLLYVTEISARRQPQSKIYRSYTNGSELELAITGDNDVGFYFSASSLMIAIPEDNSDNDRNPRWGVFRRFHDIGHCTTASIAWRQNERQVQYATDETRRATKKTLSRACPMSHYHHMLGWENLLLPIEMKRFTYCFVCLHSLNHCVQC